MVKIGNLRTLLLMSGLALSQPFHVSAAQAAPTATTKNFAAALYCFLVGINKQLDEVAKCRNAQQAYIELKKIKNMRLSFDGANGIKLVAGSTEIVFKKLNLRLQSEVLPKLMLLTPNDRFDVLANILRTTIVKIGKQLFTNFDGADYARDTFESYRLAERRAVTHYNALLTTIDQALAPLIAQRTPAPAVQRVPSSPAPQAPIAPTLAPKPAQPQIQPAPTKPQTLSVPKPVIVPQQPQAPVKQQAVQKPQTPVQPVAPKKIEQPKQVIPVAPTAPTQKPQVQQPAKPIAPPTLTPVQKQQQQTQQPAIDLQAIRASMQQIAAILAAKQQKPAEKSQDKKTVTEPKPVQETPVLKKTEKPDEKVAPQTPKKPVAAPAPQVAPVVSPVPAPAQPVAFEQKPAAPITQPAQQTVAADEPPALNVEAPTLEQELPAQKQDFTLTQQDHAVLDMFKKAYKAASAEIIAKPVVAVKAPAIQQPNLALAPQQEAEPIEAFEIPKTSQRQEVNPVQQPVVTTASQKKVKSSEQIQSEALEAIRTTYEKEHKNASIVQKNPTAIVKEFLVSKNSASTFDKQLCDLLNSAVYSEKNVTAQLKDLYETLAQNFSIIISKDGRTALQKELDGFEFDAKKYDQHCCTLFRDALQDKDAATLVPYFQKILQQKPHEGWKKLIEKIQRPYKMMLTLPQPPATVTINHLGDYVQWYLQDFAPHEEWGTVESQLNFLCDLLHVEGCQMTAKISIDYARRYIEPSLIEVLGVL